MRSKLKNFPLLLLPPLAWLTVFFVVPLLIVLFYSLCQRGIYGGVIPKLGFAAYSEVVDPLYVSVLLRTAVTAGWVTLLTLAAAYPLAYTMAFASRRLRAVMMFLMMVPFCTNFMIRMYSMFALLGDKGWLNSALLAFGVIEQPLRMINTPIAVYVGFIYWSLPFMVLPIYAALDRMDNTLLEASMDLGAGKVRTFLKITLPRSLPGIYAGIIFTYMPALGNFVIPEVLGGADEIMIGNIISSAFTQARNWPFGAALSTLLMAVVMIFVVLYLRFADPDRAEER